MSRHVIRGGGLVVVVGWDPILKTYFAQIWDDFLTLAESDSEEHEPLLRIGLEYEEVPTVRALARAIRPLACLPLGVTLELIREQAQMPPFRSYVLSSLAKWLGRRGTSMVCLYRWPSWIEPKRPSESD